MIKISKLQQRLASGKNKRRSVFAQPAAVMSQSVYKEDETNGPIKRVIFMGRDVVKGYRFNENDVVISVSDCDTPVPVFEHRPKEVLRLSFQDYVTELERKQFGWHWMKAGDGDLIAEFVQKNKDADTIVVHCNYGQSRSKAIAIVIAEYTKRKLLYVNDFGSIVAYRPGNASNGNSRVGDITRCGFECLSEPII